MANGVLEVPPVAKKGKKPEPDEVPADFGRIELRAEPEWIEQLDQAAKALGVSRSAYIRMACNRQMAADKRQAGEE